jgi:O-methyltransferase domain
VDVAGGHGLLLATILARNPQMSGTLYEMPHVLEGCRNGPLTPVMDRCTLTSGDMFSSVPAGADAYIMKHIIHDWPDDVCIKILSACRKGVNPGGRLLVVDAVIHPGNEFSPGKILDLQMLIFPRWPRTHRETVWRIVHRRGLEADSHYPDRCRRLNRGRNSGLVCICVRIRFFSNAPSN